MHVDFEGPQMMLYVETLFSGLRFSLFEGYRFSAVVHSIVEDYTMFSLLSAC